jgi:hypothetical protein
LTTLDATRIDFNRKNSAAKRTANDRFTLYSLGREYQNHSGIWDVNEFQKSPKEKSGR